MGPADDVYVGQLQARYGRAGKKEKSLILDEVTKTTGYHRKHAMAVLSGRRRRAQGPFQRPRRAPYGAEEGDVSPSWLLSSTTSAQNACAWPSTRSRRGCARPQSRQRHPSVPSSASSAIPPSKWSIATSASPSPTSNAPTRRPAPSPTGSSDTRPSRREKTGSGLSPASNKHPVTARGSQRAAT